MATVVALRDSIAEGLDLGGLGAVIGHGCYRHGAPLSASYLSVREGEGSYIVIYIMTLFGGCTRCGLTLGPNAAGIGGCRQLTCRRTSPTVAAEAVIRSSIEIVIVTYTSRIACWTVLAALHCDQYPAAAWARGEFEVGS